jgi:hypothetical protein
MIKQISWSEPAAPSGLCSYHYVVGQTAIGYYLITWKDWKDYPSYCVEKTPFNEWLMAGGSLEEAKQAAWEDFQRKILSCLAAPSSVK